jgi:hypothetical protein
MYSLSILRGKFKYQDTLPYNHDSLRIHILRSELVFVNVEMMLKEPCLGIHIYTMLCILSSN